MDSPAHGRGRCRFRCRAQRRAILDLENRLTSHAELSSDIPAAYSDFLQWCLDRATVVGSDSLRAQLEFASRLAIDPYRDAAALIAFDNAMAGVVTEVDHFDGADFTYYYAPEDYGGGAVARISVRSRQPVQPDSARSVRALTAYRRRSFLEGPGRRTAGRLIAIGGHDRRTDSVDRRADHHHLCQWDLYSQCDQRSGTAQRRRNNRPVA